MWWRARPITPSPGPIPAIRPTGSIGWSCRANRSGRLRLTRARETNGPVFDHGAETLGQRIEVGDAPDELAFLASTLNDLLERLQRSFESQRRFMADASHELRTPISVIQGEADVILSREDRGAAEYRESIEIMRRSSRRLTRIVENLFLLARTDAGSYPTSKRRVDLEEAILDCVRIMRSIAAAKRVEVTCEVPRDSRGDGRDARRDRATVRHEFHHRSQRPRRRRDDPPPASL